MTKEEYDKEMLAIEQKYKANKNELYSKYVLANKKYSKGDVLKKNDTVILVDKYSVIILGGYPDIAYDGVELKKDLQPKKNGSRSGIFGDINVEKIK